jgi:ribosome-binding ATPase YchF (GTP1/OBG family)
MKVGIIGRTNVGKSTFFKALTLEEINIEDRPFTTIEPNKGIAHVTVNCPEVEFHTKCSPRNSPCSSGVRFVPIDIIDVAGLIEGASEGHGLGNKFLSEAMEADGLIEIIDISGKTNGTGNPSTDYDPKKDVAMVRNELKLWIKSIILRSRLRGGEDLAETIYKNLSGLKFKLDTVKNAIKDLGIKTIDESSADALSAYVLNKDKPIIVACNKMDATENLEERLYELKKSFDYTFMPCSAAAELTLKEAEKHGFIEYVKNNVKLKKELNKDQKKALDIVIGVIKKNSGTGVQEILNELVLRIMGYKVVFTVEDEKKLTDGRGRVLPDAYVVSPTSTPRDVAELIHSDLAKKYKGAIDCKTGLKVKNDEPVKNGQVLKIII